MSFTRYKPRVYPVKPVMWALVDCNSFYCSCERLFRPDIRDKPVVVLSNNDGCLIALTPEARALGFAMGDVYFQVKHRLRRCGVEVFSSNYTLYGDISARVMRTIATLAPIEQYSIDETFIPLDRVLAAQAEDMGWAVHDRVAKWVGMPVRVGIGTTRTLAKLANHWAKKVSRVLKLCHGDALTEELLEKTPAEDVWGIGRRMAKRLERYGVRNARQLRDMPPLLAKNVLTVVGEKTVRELGGFPCIMQDEAPVPRKTLVSSRSFGRRTSAREDLAQALTMHAQLAGERLRAENMVAGMVRVWAQTSRHTEKPCHGITAHTAVTPPSNNTGDLVKAALRALDLCYEPGHGFMKGGLMLYELEEEGSRQLTLVEACAGLRENRNKALMDALDAVNGRYGRDTLHYGSQGPETANWHMTRNLMSRRFTTRADELLVVRAGNLVPAHPANVRAPVTEKGRPAPDAAARVHDAPGRSRHGDRARRDDPGGLPGQ